jgi:alpha-L-fucosidase
VSIGHSSYTPITSAPMAPIAASRSSSHPGQQVVLSGAGYTPGARIAIWFHSNPVLLGYATANSAGHFSVEVTVPTSALPGDHHFVAEGLYEGKVESFTTSVQVTLPAPPGHSHTETLVLVLVALLVPAAAWSVMALVARRRRGSSAPV